MVAVQGNILLQNTSCRDSKLVLSRAMKKLHKQKGESDKVVSCLEAQSDLSFISSLLVFENIKGHHEPILVG